MVVVPFSRPHADAALNFFESVLRHSADEWYGKPFLLCPWEEEAINRIYGDLNEDGERVVEMVYLELPKKPLAITTPIPTELGWKTMGDVEVGDRVLDESGNLCRVIDTSPVFYNRECYRLSFRDGHGLATSFIVADASHEWPIHDGLDRVTTKQLYESGYYTYRGPRGHTLTEVCRTESVPVRCITVDSPTHIFLVGNDLVPSGNSGKTEFASGIVLLELIMNSKPGCQVYGAAAVSRQALNVYRAACKMVEQSPILTSSLRLLRGTSRILKRSDPESFYAAVPADGDFGDGVNPALTVADELHRWRTRKQIENWDVLANGGITRQRTLTIAITTAGVQNESPLAWRLHEKTVNIAKGIIEDPGFYGRIYAADKKDPVDSPRTWIKANPSLKQNGGFLDIEKVRKKYVELSSEGDLTSFKRYFLNLWDQKEDRLIDMEMWDKCQDNCDWVARGLLPAIPAGDLVRPLPDSVLKHFIDRPCWAGVDLSMTTDLSAVVFVFPREGEDEAYDWLSFFWIPETTVLQKERKDGMPYRKWIDDGYMETCPGNVINHSVIRERLEWGSRVFDLREICFDRYNSRELSTKMIRDGFACIDIQQGMVSLSAPSKKVMELIAGGKLYHGGHPVLKWNASCVSGKEENDLLMFTKPERTRTSNRIDGVSAGVDGLYRAMLFSPSVYEGRGAIIVSG
jgi:phage terminase large subunit-like protein